eukprot:Nitzschia sp. Nitz4//scaffold333_size18811//2089//3204//NITZ4_008751-RA/size18811-augustus-gene-0.40-mRNA-1//-1//CDS//3329548217//8876//frame0
MALVNVVDMEVLDNPTCFLNPFQFQITFECLQELEDDLEWKVVYVGSAQDATRDQILDEVLVGPVPVGVNKFVLQADAPDPKALGDDLLGVTVVLVTCSYREREFVRVGYYVNNEYHDPNAPPPAPAAEGEPPVPPPLPSPIPLERIQRQILADKPRVTKFPIPWGDEPMEDTTATANGANAPMHADAAAAPSLQGSMMAAVHANGGNPFPSTGGSTSDPMAAAPGALSGGMHDVVSMQEESNTSFGNNTNSNAMMPMMA